VLFWRLLRHRLRYTDPRFMAKSRLCGLSDSPRSLASRDGANERRARTTVPQGRGGLGEVVQRDQGTRVVLAQGPEASLGLSSTWLQWGNVVANWT
jgi:hypothetical protein